MKKVRYNMLKLKDLFCFTLQNAYLSCIRKCNLENESEQKHKLTKYQGDLNATMFGIVQSTASQNFMCTSIVFVKAQFSTQQVQDMT